MKEKGLLQANIDLKKMVEGMGDDLVFGELWDNGWWCFRSKNGLSI
jgi:hypothetical protein